MKVWGGNVMFSSGQRRAIIAAESKKEAVALIQATSAGYGFSRYYFDTYWGETGNTKELEIAQHRGVWVNLAQWEELTPLEAKP